MLVVILAGQQQQVPQPGLRVDHDQAGSRAAGHRDVEELAFRVVANVDANAGLDVLPSIFATPRARAPILANCRSIMCAFMVASSRELQISISGKRKERESNPQGRKAQPASNRVPSPIGLPFRLLDCRFSSPTRTRTRNLSLEARHDVRFTIGP